MNKKSHSFFTIGLNALLVVLLLLGSTGSALADTQTEVGSYPDINDGNSYSSPGGGPGSFFFAAEDVTGIDKFDPSLGTLNTVTLFAEFVSDVETSVSADAVDTDSDPHYVEFDGDFLQAFIGYSPGGGGSTFTLVSSNYVPFASCGDGEFSGGCFDSVFDSNHANSSDVVSNLASYDSNDFIGVGPVTTLRAIIAIPEDGTFFLDNVDTASAEIAAYMSNISLTVEYDYTPIPEPTSALLALLAGCAMLTSRRRI